MTAPPARRRWYQFSLLALLLLIAAIGILSALARRNVLAEKTTVVFNAQPLFDVISYLSVNHDYRCLVDKTALDDAGIDPNQIMITDQATAVPLGDTLKQLLEPHGLGYRIESGDLVITTQEALRSPPPTGSRKLIDIKNDPDWP